MFLRQGNGGRFETEQADRLAERRKMKRLIILALAIAASACTKQASTKTVEIDTSEWICAKTEQRKYQYPQMIGKITIMQTGTRSECVEWRKP